MEERLQKLLASAGLCSRRASEELIRSGRVRVDGRTAGIGDKADPEKSVITVDGKQISFTASFLYLMLNKPRGYVTTMADERGRPTAAELVSDCGARVLPVGRLDMDSEGLLLFTNDGALMQRMLHPKYEVKKVYRVRVAGALAAGAAALRAMRTLEGAPIAPAAVEILSDDGREGELSVTIHEGKNRQIRRMCAAAGLRVLRLCRVEEHGLTLGALKSGAWRYLTAAERARLPAEAEKQEEGTT